MGEFIAREIYEKLWTALGAAADLEIGVGLAAPNAEEA